MGDVIVWLAFGVWVAGATGFCAAIYECDTADGKWAPAKWPRLILMSLLWPLLVSGAAVYELIKKEWLTKD